MNELIQTLKVLLGSTVALKYKAHGYHWNVEGDDFPQWHDKFGDIYENLDGSIDGLAEWIRMISEDYAPFKLSRFAALSTIPESDVSSDPMSSKVSKNGAQCFTDKFGYSEKYSFFRFIPVKSKVDSFIDFYNIQNMFHLKKGDVFCSVNINCCSVRYNAAFAESPEIKSLIIFFAVGIVKHLVSWVSV